MSNHFGNVGGDQVSAYVIIRDENGNPIWWDGSITVNVGSVTTTPIPPVDRVHLYNNRSSPGIVITYTVPAGKRLNISSWSITSETPAEAELLVDSIRKSYLLIAKETRFSDKIYGSNTPISVNPDVEVKINMVFGDKVTHYELCGWLEDV